MKKYTIDGTRVVVEFADGSEQELAQLTGRWENDSLTIGRVILADCLGQSIAENEDVLARFLNGPIASMSDADNSVLEESQVHEFYRQKNLLR